MIDKILTAAGIPFRQARWPDPPEGTYALTFDDVEADGPDGMPARIFAHNVTVELYEDVADPEAEAAFEAQLAAEGIHWAKQARYWLDNIKKYQTIYEFTYITKT